MRPHRSCLALASCLAAPGALADTVEATSTTYLSSGKQPARAPGQATDAVSVMPVWRS